jgi:hypothetical protein
VDSTQTFREFEPSGTVIMDLSLFFGGKKIPKGEFVDKDE